MRYIFLLFCLLSLSAYAQEPAIQKKEYTILKTEDKPKIDGLIEDELWASMPLLTDFTESSPAPNTASSKRTEVRMMYDDEAIYIAARMYDNPDSINNFLSERDNIGNADFFLVTFNNYRDGLNGEGFIVMPSGVQFDTKYSTDGESAAWDAVWESATTIDDKGWTAELKIPFAALRFPEVDEQLWGINFGREIRRIRERSYWNPIDPTVDGFLTQSGLLKGIKNIKAPVRLFFFPYTTGYAETNSADGGSENYSLNAGLDVKYGLNDAFTLDMTLIPDFSQARFDNQVLNLSQFEIQFNENRQFFTEGVELFTKSGLFFSRRVGDRPFRSVGNIDSTESIVENPSQSQLLNAAKVSGRNKNGLGVGFFNAVENREKAVIENNENGSKREVLVNPLTNYNVLVLDQVLRNNSFVTFTNTNVSRDGTARDANVSQLDLQVADKKNKYAVSGSAAMSHLFEEGDIESGSRVSAAFEKISGNLTYGISQDQITDTYNPNDLGFLRIMNLRTTSGTIQYQRFQTEKFNFWRHRVEVDYNRIYRPDNFANFSTGWSSVYGLKGFHAFGVNAGVEPFKSFDFFETRSFEQFYRFPKNFWYGGFFSSDYSRPFAYDIRLSHRVFDEPGRYNTSIFLSTRFQPNDKIFLVLDFTRSQNENEIGYANESNDRNDINPDSIIFGRRDIDVHVSAIRANYIFNNKMALNLDLRHNWSTATYDRLYNLDDEDGTVTIIEEDKNNERITENNVSFSAFNIDLGFRWRFAPGSDINVVYKNVILTNGGDPLERNYFRDLDATLNAPQINSVSIRVAYFVDYLTLRGKKRA